MIEVELEVARKLLSESLIIRELIEELDLIDALGRILSENIEAPMDQPPFNRSPLDGIALKSLDTLGATMDTPVRLKIKGKAYAGHPFAGCIGDKEAILIMTGAPMPEGADCVIRQELLEWEEDEVLVRHQMRPYDNYCFQGEDIQKGTQLLLSGQRLTAIEIGVLASVGISKVKVRRKLKVGLLTTGDEVQTIDKPLKRGQIYNSNLYLLMMRLKELGMEPIVYTNVKDDAHSIAMQIEKCYEDVDILITTGGVSVGERDQMHQVLKILEAKRLFWRIQMQPGTPMLGAIYKEKLILALSGNPFAALTNFELVVRPILSQLSGDASIELAYNEALLGEDFMKKSIKRRFIRARYEDGKVTLGDGHASGMLRSMIGCNALIDIPAGTERLKKGEKVKVVLL